jgi:hypothetical protein
LTFNTIYFAKHGNLGGLMKKVFIILLVVILLLSLGFNLKTIREKNYHKEIMISNFYATIIGATRNFESFKTAIDENDIQNAKIQLEYAALGLIEADNQLVNLGMEKGILDEIIELKAENKPESEQQECMNIIVRDLLKEAKWV